jgi:Short C-terminal domain
VRYWVVGLLGLAVCGASMVAMDWGLYHLVRTGTCASGGPYVSARPCPPGTAGHILAVIFGTFAGLIGIGIWAARGPGNRRPSPVGLGAIMWALLFCTLAGSAILAAFGPASSDDSGAKTTAAILGVIFIPMGLAPIPLAFMGRRKSARAADLVSHGRRCTGEVIAVHDTGVTINDNPRVKMEIRADPPGEPPFTIEKTAVVSRVQIPRPGDHCVVFYDPSDREHRNGVTFDPVPGFAMPTVPVAPSTGAAAPSPSVVADEQEDAIEKIEKLGELRDKGLITAEEFEAQKKRLLDEI